MALGTSGCFPAAALLLSLAACSGVPDAYHVTRGTEPRHVDDDVRFRTTYYFRVFDLCEVRDQPSGVEPRYNLFPARNVAGGTPQKDSIYRFRMTGKASSLFSQVHFESGTLRASDIDPFGATVTYDDDTKQFHVQSQGQTQADADRARRLKGIERLRDMAAHMPVGTARQELETQLVREIQGLSYAPAIPATLSQPGIAQLTVSVARRVEQLQTALAADARGAAAALLLKSPKDDVAKAQALAMSVKAIGLIAQDARILVLSLREGTLAAQAKLVEINEAIKDKPADSQAVSSLLELTAATLAAVLGADAQLVQQMAMQAGIAASAPAALPASPPPCAPGIGPRRGFQILGPEGLRTFDQDERLLMAMSSDGKPLIGLLQELSSRVIGNKVNPADRLLPIAREQVNLGNARLTLVGTGQSPVTQAEANQRLDAAVQSLKGE
jgi:hypothetical protein